MKKFARLFEFDDIGQVLFVLDEGIDGPEIKIRAAEYRGIDLAITMSGYTDDDAGWDEAEGYLDTIDEIAARESATLLFTMIDEMKEKFDESS
jgi:hypothetical protein